MLSESPGTPGCIEKSYFDCKSTTTFSAPSCSYIYRYHTDRVCMLGVERRLREQNERQRSKYFDVCVCTSMYRVYRSERPTFGENAMNQ